MIRVLVIDDETEIVKVITNVYAQNFEATVDYALNGQDGLKLAEEYHYDMICVDYCMPKLNGIEFLKALREGKGINSDSSVLFITGYEPELDTNDDLWNKVYFIKKPFIRDSIINYSKMAIASSSKPDSTQEES